MKELPVAFLAAGNFVYVAYKSFYKIVFLPMEK
jgi:hypothetical protein